MEPDHHRTEHDDVAHDERLKLVDVRDVPTQILGSQLHGDRTASIHLSIMEWTSGRAIAHTRYDPGLVVPRHGHRADVALYVLDGDMAVEEHRCTAGTLVLLKRGTLFGPLVAGPDGCTFLEWYDGDVTVIPGDPREHQRFLDRRGIVALPNPSVRRPPGAPDISVNRYLDT